MKYILETVLNNLISGDVDVASIKLHEYLNDKSSQILHRQTKQRNFDGVQGTRADYHPNTTTLQLRMNSDGSFSTIYDPSSYEDNDEGNYELATAKLHARYDLLKRMNANNTDGRYDDNISQLKNEVAKLKKYITYIKEKLNTSDQFSDPDNYETDLYSDKQYYPEKQRNLDKKRLRAGKQYKDQVK